MKNAAVDNSLTIDTSTTNKSLEQWEEGAKTTWDYWYEEYYPQVIERSYPVYIKEKAQDKGKKAHEVIKELKDEDFLKIDTVGDYIDLMDKLIKIL